MARSTCRVLGTVITLVCWWSGGRRFKLQPHFYRVDNYGKLWMTEITATTVSFFCLCCCFASIIVSFYSFLSYLQLININKWLEMLYSPLIAFLSFCFFLKQTVTLSVSGTVVNVEVKRILGMIFLLRGLKHLTLWFQIAWLNGFLFLKIPIVSIKILSVWL